MLDGAVVLVARACEVERLHDGCIRAVPAPPLKPMEPVMGTRAGGSGGSASDQGSVALAGREWSASASANAPPIPLTFHGPRGARGTPPCALGLGLFLVGLLATIVCTMHGCGTFFPWNGRHTVQSQLLTKSTRTRRSRPGLPSIHAQRAGGLRPRLRGRQVRHGRGRAQDALVVKAKDSLGHHPAEVSGWLERDKPNIFYSRPLQQPGREIMVERLVGPSIRRASRRSVWTSTSGPTGSAGTSSRSDGSSSMTTRCRRRSGMR